MSYDRVDYSDKAHFSSPSDEHHYSDDPARNGSRHANGNGIYNDYTVELKPKSYGQSYKFLCFECKNTKRVKFIMAGACFVFCMAMVLVIISAVAHQKQKSKQKAGSKPLPTYGLLAYGPDNSGLISFNALDHKSYMKYFHQLEAGLADYNTWTQAANLDKYIPCHDNTTVVPEGKVCMLTLEQFGNNCQNFELYGIQEERPCVLLVLKPEENLMPKPFDFTGGKNAELKAKLGNRISNNSVAISCEGKTAQDKALLQKMNYTNSIDYNPPRGFPLYYFLQRDTDGYIYPAVMVQFNSVPNRHKVTVKCTAWAQNFNDGEPQNSTEYSTEFSILIT